jgi:hypothetical protein
MPTFILKVTNAIMGKIFFSPDSADDAACTPLAACNEDQDMNNWFPL